MYSHCFAHSSDGFNSQPREGGWQYQSDLQVLGEREALEFARFRADALADANEQAAQSFHHALIIGAIYAAALAFAIGFMIGRAV